MPRPLGRGSKGGSSGKVSVVVDRRPQLGIPARSRIEGVQDSGVVVEEGIRATGEWSWIGRNSDEPFEIVVPDAKVEVRL